jgi:nicotinate phosphoribosyltransferase
VTIRACGWQVSPGLFTDLYQLTMAYGYWKSGVVTTEACFHLSFRENPFGGGYALACGLEQASQYLSELRFSSEDIEHLAAMKGNDGERLFDPAFFEWLADFRFDADVDAVPEGTVVFPREPILRVRGPIASCQLVETALLNIINFQTLIATKAARVCQAAGGDPVVEFGLRRAQGPDGGISASRAAYIGGCTGTSNTLASSAFGIPAAGTHAHSWVMLFDSEAEAFERYADAMPNNCTLLVDTYDTLEGVRRAIEIGKVLSERGHEMIGVRIDSGDLAWLSRKARELLDDAGLSSARIFASNELDEHLIESLKDQGAAIDVWGVGTKLVTAYEQPALGGVYKLSAVRENGGRWVPRIKVSEQTAKVTTPGVQNLRRYSQDGVWIGDMVYDAQSPPDGEGVMVDPEDSTRRKSFEPTDSYEELLVPITRGGQVVSEAPSIEAVRNRAAAQLDALDPSIKRFLNPHSYPVGLEKGLSDTRTRLIMEARGLDEEE